MKNIDFIYMFISIHTGKCQKFIGHPHFSTLVLLPINSFHLDYAKAPGLRLPGRGVVLREYYLSPWQLNRGSFRATPSGRKLWEEAPVY